MKNALLILAIAIIALIAPGHAQSAESHAGEFSVFHAKFIGAAKANDKEKLAELIAFPVDDWSVERKGDVQTIAIKDRADFLARYDTLVTASMRAHAASAKPQPLKDGRYVVIWDDADAEYSFAFGYSSGAGYRVTSFSIGPR